MARKTFLQGAVVLGVAGLIIKVMGAVFRIPLANIIGDTGMGYYQTAYPVYVLLLTLSTAGVPVAISRMVAERNALGNNYEAYRVFRISFALLFAIGISSSAVLFFGAEAIVTHLGNPGAKMAMMSIAPALLFVPMMASFRGFFQGLQNMNPTAISQVVEQLFRVSAGLTLAVVLVDRGLEYAAAGASFGATAGSVVGLLTVVGLFLYHRRSILEGVVRIKGERSESSSRILIQILAIAIPITIGAAIMPIMNTIDVAIVIKRLAASGFTPDAANSLYGQLTGMAGPLINFPQVLTQAIAMSLVPAVAAAYKRKEMDFLRYNVELGLRTSLILGLPCALGLMTLSEPIMLLLYPAQRASAVSAAPSLFILSFGVIFLATVQTLTGVLQGIGKQLISVRNLAVGALAKVVLTYYLTAIPSVNIRGAAVGTVCAYIVASTLNLLAVTKYTGTRFDLRLTIIKPLISGLVMSAFVFATHRVVYIVLGNIMDSINKANALATLLAILVGVLVYFVMLLKTRTITSEELKLLPKEDKWIRLFDRFKK
ncbi:MAG: polysaccharide biosynthesis protein [Clostridiales Family XIII bacterium]|jgi:stage V sporulation protein B|nr:polysaccharide biosynthesis protein [Clostridiales Family XIII bacterium]